MKFPVYSLMYALAAAAVWPVYVIRGITGGKYTWSLGRRLGLTLPRLQEKSAPRVWVHALSLGEVTSAVELIGALRGKGYDVCLSTTTKSGHEAAERLFPDLPRFCLPFDLPPAVNRVLNAVRPDLFVILETDIWPNILSILKRRGVPVILVNARVSPRSFRGYRLIRFFWRRVLNLADVIACQSEGDRDRLTALGALPERVKVTGNLKFDRSRPDTGPRVKERLLEKTGLPEGPWLVAGSTHPGEDEILCELFGAWQKRHHGLRMLLAPRNRERFEPVWRLICRTGVSAARRTGPPPDDRTRIFLLDTLGELDAFYEIADLVFVGKSLPVPGEGGGHNLIEPALRSKPVLFGPRMQNFKEISRLLSDSGGGRRVEDAEDLQNLCG